MTAALGLASSLGDAARALRAGEVSAVELLDAACARADSHDRSLGVYVERFDAAARDAAVRADAELAAGVDRGPLHGIPIGVKDIFAAREGATTGQSLALGGGWAGAEPGASAADAWAPAGQDAPAVARLRAAGAVLTGKLTTMELAIGIPDADTSFPLPRNPWNVGTWAGGSSSGAASGVAAGMFFGALGSDTGGSIRVPAAFCGVSGLMPTYGCVPKSGAVPLAFTLDHAGPLARSAADCGALLQALAGFDPSDPASRRDIAAGDFLARSTDQSLDGVRIGVERANHLGREGEDAALEGVFEEAIGVLRGLGADVREVTIPRYDAIFAAYWVTMTCEALAIHGEALRERWEDMLASTRTTIAAGALFSGADYVQAQRMRRVAQRDLAALFADVDLIVTPTANRGAPALSELRTGVPMAVFRRTLTPYWDVVGNPVLAIPMGFDSDGLPLSLQLAARPWEEALLVRAGDAFQRTTDWHARMPAFADRPVGRGAPAAAAAGPVPAAPAAGPVPNPRQPAPAGPVALVDAALAAAGLAPGPRDRAAIAARYAQLRSAVDALHADPAAQNEPHGLRFDADQISPNEPNLRDPEGRS